MKESSSLLSHSNPSSFASFGFVPSRCLAKFNSFSLTESLDCKVCSFEWHSEA